MATNKDADPANDLFANRENPHPTTDNETLIHLMKASVGTGILGMPFAFMNSGLLLGIFTTIFTSVLCTHCSYILVQCAHKLCYRTGRSALTYVEVAELAFKTGPPGCHCLAIIFMYVVPLSILASYFGICAVYTVLVAKSFEQVIEHWFNIEVPIRVAILVEWLPLVLLSLIPNLKYLAPVSMIANIFMVIGLGITMSYIVVQLPPLETREYALFNTLPTFFSICLFALAGIGVTMPLENNMKTPTHFIGICGVLNRGMLLITIIYIALGFFGYLRYGPDTDESITLNLPVEEWLAQTVKLFIGLAVFGTFGIQFFVCLETVWEIIKHKCVNHETVAKVVVRILLATLIVLLAVAVPSIAPFMGLVGAMCLSVLGLMLPVIIEIVVLWDTGFGCCYWIMWKNVFIMFCGVAALIFGTLDSLRSIAAMYSEEE